MRKIKFRAWDKDLKKMFYSQKGDFMVGGHGACGFCSEWIEELIAGSFVKNGIHSKKILLQFTGLKDKNNTEIYEGDIVEYYQFSQCCSQCAHREKSTNEIKFNALGVTLSSYRVIDPMSDISELEIIGNIHESPELME